MTWAGVWELQPSSCTTPSSIAGPSLKLLVLLGYTLPCSHSSIPCSQSCSQSSVPAISLSAPVGTAQSTSTALVLTQARADTAFAFCRCCKRMCSSNIPMNMWEIKLLVLQVFESTASTLIRSKAPIRLSSSLRASVLSSHRCSVFVDRVCALRKRAQHCGGSVVYLQPIVVLMQIA